MKVIVWSLVTGLGLFAVSAGVASANDPWDDDDHHSDHCDHDHDWWDDDFHDDHDDEDHDHDSDDCDNDKDDHDGHGHGECWDGGPVSVAVSPSGSGAISWVGGGIAFGAGGFAASWTGSGFAGDWARGHAYSGDDDCFPPIVFAPQGQRSPHGALLGADYKLDFTNNSADSNSDVLIFQPQPVY